MRLVCAAGVGLAPLRGRLNFPGHSLTLIAKATLALVPGGVARLLTDRPAMPTGDQPYPDDELGLGTPRYPSDFAFEKPRAEVTVVGHFCAPDGKPVRASEVVFSIDGRVTRLSVIGRRCFRGGSHLPGANEAEPFKRLPLRWEHAYGGAGHRFNPVGTGYVSPESMRHQGEHGPARDFARDPLELPRIERPDRLFTHLDQVLEPVCFAPRAASWPVRRDLFGKCDERWLKARWPWFPEDFDARYFLSALPALQQPAYLRGDETLRFKNMHERVPSYQTSLPGSYAIAVVQRQHAAGAYSLSTEAVRMNLDTLWVDMDAERAQLVWRGTVACKDAEASDIAYAWVGIESRTLTLSSADVRARGAAAIADEEAQWNIVAEREPEPPAPELEREAPKAEQARSSAEERALTAVLASLPAGPEPTLLTPAQQEILEDAAATVMCDLETETEHERGAFEPPPWTRERVRANRDTPGALRGVDLSGLDLSGLDLSGVDLSGALLVGARLDGARLHGANLSRASLRQASLTDCDLSEATLEDALLSECHGERLRIDRTKLTRANLNDCAFPALVLKDSDLSLALAERAQLKRAQFAGCVLDEAVFDCASLEQAQFSKCTLRGARFVAAQLPGAHFSECVLNEADLEQCNLAEATIFRSGLDDVHFEGAKAKGLQIEESSVARLRAADAELNFTQWRNVVGKDLICEGARFADARLEHCQLPGADFSAVDFSRARIRGCALPKAKLGNADLSEAQLLGSNCFEATFEAARLVHCDGSGSSFYRAEFLNAEAASFYGQDRDLSGTKLEQAEG